jgi:hypothetical protein
MPDACSASSASGHDATALPGHCSGQFRWISGSGQINTRTVQQHFDMQMVAERQPAGWTAVPLRASAIHGLIASIRMRLQALPRPDSRDRGVPWTA